MAMNSAPNGMPEDVRVGWHTTLIGRKLDQGILVKMVLEDTDIRRVHQVKLAATNEAKTMGSAAIRGEAKATSMIAMALEGSPFETCCSSTAADGIACGTEPAQAAREAVATKKARMKVLMEKAMTAYSEGEYSKCEALAAGHGSRP